MTAPEDTLRQRLFHGLSLIWIAGTSLFFFLRFSFTFYYANDAAIRRFLDSILSR